MKRHRGSNMRYVGALAALNEQQQGSGILATEELINVVDQVSYGHVSHATGFSSSRRSSPFTAAAIMAIAGALLVDLGRRHGVYGARVEHYAAVEACLLYTIETIMGPQCTLDVKLAWTSIYNFIAQTMIEAQLT